MNPKHDLFARMDPFAMNRGPSLYLRIIGVLSKSALLVYARLNGFAHHNGWCRATNESISLRTGLSDKTVRRAIKEMEAAGIITCQYNGAETPGKVGCFRRIFVRNEDAIRGMIYEKKEWRPKKHRAMFLENVGDFSDFSDGDADPVILTARPGHFDRTNITDKVTTPCKSPGVRAVALTPVAFSGETHGEDYSHGKKVAKKAMKAKGGRPSPSPSSEKPAKKSPEAKEIVFGVALPAKTDPDVMAEKLLNGLAKHRKVVGSAKPRGWSAIFRKLVQEEGMSAKRVFPVLDWYVTKNLGSDFEFAAYCAKSFAKKFIAMETAMKRDENKSAGGKKSVSEEIENKYGKIADKVISRYDTNHVAKPWPMSTRAYRRDMLLASFANREAVIDDVHARVNALDDIAKDPERDRMDVERRKAKATVSAFDNYLCWLSGKLDFADTWLNHIGRELSGWKTYSAPNLNTFVWSVGSKYFKSKYEDMAVKAGCGWTAFNTIFGCVDDAGETEQNDNDE